MKQVIHFNGKFWVQEGSERAVLIAHKDAVKLVQDKAAEYVKGATPTGYQVGDEQKQ